eukprot:NODE_3995_length_853_cov_4.385572_g3313_i0.p1 GENE.NODE_3995_length_853_cov_4.385572_g3313_i0~~NODE_3995_length_853_cov_4.385572_g3313_i0.p1  ORF type:complete len:240 (+),score=1.17 NODE_3995_length_853_cov_4.385572_g3313_i0:94-720(+)
MTDMKQVFGATAFMVVLAPAAQALDVGVGIGIGGDSGVGVGAGISVDHGVGVGVGTSVGGDHGVSAGAGATVGGHGRTGPDVGVAVGVAVGGSTTGPSPTSPTPATPTTPSVKPAAVAAVGTDAVMVNPINIAKLIGTPVWSRDKVLIGMVEQVAPGPSGKVDTVIRLNAALATEAATVEMRLTPTTDSRGALRIGFTKAQFLELYSS